VDIATWKPAGNQSALEKFFVKADKTNTTFQLFFKKQTVPYK